MCSGQRHPGWNVYRPISPPPIFTTSTAWLRDHPNLRARTRENYAGNLRNHILPVIGALPLNQLSPNVIRRWHAALSRGGQLSPSTVAKCYRLVHAILETAVADELIVKNPCLVRGAAQDRSAERPIATLTEVLSLAEAVPPRYRALILTATFTGLRHTGNTLAAATGASTCQLMARMGHASPRAALIYQHATSERDHAIAAALGDMLANAAPAPSAPVHRIRQSR